MVNDVNHRNVRTAKTTTTALFIEMLKGVKHDMVLRVFFEPQHTGFHHRHVRELEIVHSDSL